MLPAGSARFHLVDLQPDLKSSGPPSKLTKEETMRKTLLTGAASAMALLVSACGSNEDVVQNDMAVSGS